MTTHTYETLDAFVATIPSGQEYAAAGTPGVDFDGRTTVAHVDIDDQRWAIHADTRASRLRDLAAHVAAGRPLYRRTTPSGGQGLSDRPDPDGLYLYTRDPDPRAGRDQRSLYLVHELTTILVGRGDLTEEEAAIVELGQVFLSELGQRPASPAELT